jgi:hypothetical protein
LLAQPDSPKQVPRLHQLKKPSWGGVSRAAEALLAFRDGFSNWNTTGLPLSWWDVDAMPCIDEQTSSRAFIVTCNSQGQVTGIKLQNMPTLQGNLAPELSLLNASLATVEITNTQVGASPAV